MLCQFEEKQYENLLSRELEKDYPIFAPGQSLEGTVGFDAAFRIINLDLWRLLGYKQRSGIQLSPAIWDAVESNINSDIFPPFQCNLVIQYKRPEKITVKHGKEWNDWKCDYFRYLITPHQQRILESLEKKTKNLAIVLYACPAFIEARRLWDESIAGTLLKASNLVRPEKLTGHHRYTFSKPGKRGRAYSEPEDIEGDDFSDAFNRLLDAEPQWRSNSEFLRNTAQAIEESLEDLGEEEAGFYLDAIRAASEATNHPLERSLNIIFVFFNTTGISWKVGYRHPMK